jgi:ribosomal protein L14E/L6E/L27E
MVDDGQHHDVRMAVFEARLNHYEAMTAHKIDEVKNLIIAAQQAWHEDRKANEAEKKEAAKLATKEKQAELEKKSAREWSMILAFLVAGIGFIANTAHSLIQMAMK